MAAIHQTSVLLIALFISLAHFTISFPALTSEHEDHVKPDTLEKSDDETQKAGRQTHTPLFVVPEENSRVTWQCIGGSDGRKRGRVIEWILPNGARVPTDQWNQSTDMVEVEFVAQIQFTRFEMRIPSVKVGMDGRYSCVFGTDADRSRKSFFIPYIVSHVGLSTSVALSLSISTIFCLVFLVVLLVDRYLTRPPVHIVAAPADDQTAQVVQRKAHLEFNNRWSIASSSIDWEYPQDLVDDVSSIHDEGKV